MKNIFYVFLGVFIFSCDEYDPNSGTPKVDIHDVANLDGSTLFTNSLTLSWEGNEFASDFSYRLEPLDYDKIVGIDTAWSEWSIDTSVTLEPLDEGEYNFYIKSRFNIETEEETQPLDVAKLLKAVIEDQNPNIVIMGCNTNSL